MLSDTFFVINLLFFLIVFSLISKLSISSKSSRLEVFSSSAFYYLRLIFIVLNSGVVSEVFILCKILGLKSCKLSSSLLSLLLMLLLLSSWFFKSRMVQWFDGTFSILFVLVLSFVSSSFYLLLILIVIIVYYNTNSFN